ncbi:MAG: TetR/AcrR family transcriptional regulator [Solirubrobacterales bacterium]|nr:helix-turn-helix domain-containing protein [Solirubrobacterales bacterium]
MPRAAYRARGRTKRSQATRARIMEATRELLDKGEFHETSVEDVAERAGVSRATVYQHFPSRLDLVDAICDTFSENPDLVALRDTVTLPDPSRALDETIAKTVGFWGSEDTILEQLYGATAIDSAARDLVERQLADRRGEMQRLARHLDEAGRLRSGVSRLEALTQLMVLTSYGTYRELRRQGLSDARAIRHLQATARRLLGR